MSAAEARPAPSRWPKLVSCDFDIFLLCDFSNPVRARRQQYMVCCSRRRRQSRPDRNVVFPAFLLRWWSSPLFWCASSLSLKKIFSNFHKWYAAMGESMSCALQPNGTSEKWKQPVVSHVPSFRLDWTIPLFSHGKRKSTLGFLQLGTFFSLEIPGNKYLFTRTYLFIHV